MRTDATTVSPQAKEEARSYIQEKYGENFYLKNQGNML
jgi:DNA topoisomerase IA